MVRDEDGERNCFLGGHRAVVGDDVRWTEAPGEGGKIVDVSARRTQLRRIDQRGGEQILAANLGGLLIVVAGQDPPFHAPLLDRYLVAASQEGLETAVVLNKVDLGVPDEVRAELAVREQLGTAVLEASVRSGVGVDGVRAFLAAHAADRPWALVGHSGVGKTSIISALLPEQDVGPIGEISEYWGTGRHTTSRSRLFDLPGGGQMVDSPGIRGFTPALLDPIDVRDHFPGLGQLGCQYRDCLHRPGEEGCVAEDEVEPSLLASWRHLLAEVEQIVKRRGPGVNRR